MTITDKLHRVLWTVHLAGKWLAMSTPECLTLEQAKEVWRKKTADSACRRVLLQVEDGLPNWKTI